MLRSAVLAPARATLKQCGGFGNSCSQNVRRKCQVSRPNRAGDGISHDIQYEGLWGAIKTFPQRKPVMTNIIIATVKTAAADAIVQSAEGKNTFDTFDFKRNAVFTAFGFGYLGVAQWFIYVTVFTRLCPHAVRFSNLSMADKMKDKLGQKDLVKQILYDNFVHYTFIYWPVFYCFKELIQGSGFGMDTVQAAMSKYWNNCVTDNLAMWGLWIPMDVVIYAVPVWLRLPMNHAVSAAWCVILSWMRGGEK